MKSLAPHFRIASLSAILALAGCATTPPAVVTVPPPADLVRPPCEPAADLMVTPAVLPEVRPGDRKFDRGLRDRAAYRGLREDMIALQEYVRSQCQ
jgi:hypothetical protein